MTQGSTSASDKARQDWQHDGFAAAARLDCRAIEQAVLEATGYRLELEEKQIQADPDAYFLSRF